MKRVEMLPDTSFLVSEERVNNSIFLEIVKNGSVTQIEKAIRERVANTDAGMFKQLDKGDHIPDAGKMEGTE